MAEYGEFKSEGIWLHFLREKNGQKAKCKNCKTVLKTAGGSTKGLHEHLRRVHSMSVLKGRKPDKDDDQSDEQAQAKKTAKPGGGGGAITKYLMNEEDKTLDETLARMTARDGLPFRLFSSSPDMRKCLHALGFGDVPTSPEGVRQRVMSHARKVRSFVTADLENKKKQGRRFSLTFDEWTSVRNRRYMAINVHDCTHFWSLGLVRVHGSMPAETCVLLVEQKLEFGLSLAGDIVCICTDGASVMTKVGKLIEAEQQLCYAHGVQLAVLDVLYRRARRTEPAQVAQAATTSTATDATTDCGNNSDDDGDDEDVDNGMEVYTDSEEYDVVAELSEDYR